jgi:hypothetical protein
VVSVCPNDDCGTPVACPINHVKCGDGLTCVLDIKFCGLRSADCDVGFVQCKTGQCAKTKNDCPTMKLCGAGLLLCPDGACVSDVDGCDDVVSCFDKLPFTCPDGSCRALLVDCPASFACATGEKKCDDNKCRAAGMACPTTATPKCAVSGYVRCPDGTCHNNPILCSTGTTCLKGEKLCSNGQCKKGSEQCPPTKSCLQDKSVLCPDGSCTSTTAQCPTDVTCSIFSPIKCSNGACVELLASCPDSKACPISSPHRCFDGTCANQLADCPTKKSCPMHTPVRCFDGSCAPGASMCAVSKQLVCKVGTVRCPGGECAGSFSECPTHVICNSDNVRCHDGSCRQDCTSLQVQRCEPFQVTCPHGNAGITCVDNIEECPRSTVCPTHMPVKCADATCAYSYEECPKVFTIPLLLSPVSPASLLSPLLSSSFIYSSSALPELPYSNKLHSQGGGCLCLRGLSGRRLGH